MTTPNSIHSLNSVNKQIALFDYDALDTETRIVVRQRTEEIKTLMRRTAQDIIDIGSKLSEVQARLADHHKGTFQSWLTSEFEWDVRTAYRFINVFKTFGYDNLSQLDFAPSALTLLAEPSTPIPARHEAIERAQTGETITHAKAQEIIAEHKSPSPSIRYVPTSELELDEEEQIVKLDDWASCPGCGEIHNQWRKITYRGNTIYDCGLCGVGDNGPTQLTPNEWAIKDKWWRRPDPPMIDETAITDVISPEPIHQEIPPMSPVNKAYKNSSESNEWYTPRSIIDKAIAVMGGIDLDPASSEEANKTVRARKIYTIEDNALFQFWDGRVWLNPPYGNDVEPFVAKLVDSYVSGDVTEALLLVAARTDTAWFRKLRDYPRCFIWGRIKFISGATGEPGDSAGFPSMVVYIGPNLDRFVEEFKTIGDIYVLLGRS